MSDKIVDAIIDQIDNHLDCIEYLLDDLKLVRADHKELVNSIYEFYIDLEKAVDRVADLRKDEKELREKDARITEALSPSLKKDIQEHVKKESMFSALFPNLDKDDDNALMEEL